MSAFLGLHSPPPRPGHHPQHQLFAIPSGTTPEEGTSSALRPHRTRRPATLLPNPLLIPPSAPCPPNKTMLQGFEWYIPFNTPTPHWRRLQHALPSLAALGVTSLWIPPACKAARPEGNGYDIHDLYDLGEFEQKGARGTKWGTKGELEELVSAAEGLGIGVLFDAVLNHKAGADYSEEVAAVRIEERDRRRQVPGGEGVIEAWTGYEFPGRGETYSALKWDWKCFTGIDYDGKTGQSGVWRFEGKKWAEDVDEELGNYDYLLGHPFLRG